MAEKRTIYTAGYNARGWTHEALRAVMNRTGAVLMDVRFSPASQRPEWRGGALRRAFDPHYITCIDLGNRNYRGGPIELADPRSGVLCVYRALDDYPAVILLCACADHRRCHRSVAAELCQSEITGYDVTIEHLDPPAIFPDLHPNGLPAVALSIMQPWAWAITEGLKPVENRTWPTNFRGPICIHAGKKYDAEGADDLLFSDYIIPPDLPRGGIVGVAEIVDCVTSHPSGWFVGPYGFVLRNARPVPFMPCRGQLGVFRWEKAPHGDMLREGGNG